MPLKDRNMLPKNIRSMREMSELHTSEQEELNILMDAIDDKVNQLFINSATSSVRRYEQLFGIPTNTDLSYYERRSTILTMLNTRPPITVKRMREVIKSITGNDSIVTEHYEDYSFDIELIRLVFNPLNLILLQKQIDLLKPAHLSYTFSISYTHYLSIATEIEVIGTSEYPITNEMICGAEPENITAVYMAAVTLGAAFIYAEQDAYPVCGQMICGEG